MSQPLFALVAWLARKLLPPPPSATCNEYNKDSAAKAVDWPSRPVNGGGSGAELLFGANLVRPRKVAGAAQVARSQPTISSHISIGGSGRLLQAASCGGKRKMRITFRFNSNSSLSLSRRQIVAC